MGVSFSKKGFVFTFLSFFIAILIFSFGFYKLSQNDYAAETSFNKGRILAVDNELKYFKNVYIKDAFKFSAYNTITTILNYSGNKTNYANLNQNYSKFNELIYEGITNSSLDGKVIPVLENKNIYDFFSEYVEIFKETYKGNISFKILDINVFESQPYYLSFQVFFKYNITLEDNLSHWESKENFEVSFPVYNLPDPEFMIQLNKSIPIRPFDLYYSNENWTYESFNKSLAGMYSTIYTFDKFKYTVGNSFINKLLNLSPKSFKNVSTFFSFDYDEKKHQVFDSSKSDLNANLFANTYLLLNFENNTNDLSSYNNSFTNYNLNFSSSPNLYFLNGNFTKATAIVNISNNNFNLNFTNNISISFWINPTSFSGTSTLFSYGASSSSEMNLIINSSGEVNFELGTQNGGTAHTFKAQTKIQTGNWTNVIAIFNGGTGEGRIYINGILDNPQSDLTYEKSAPITNFKSSSTAITIGNKPLLSDSFEGYIDEVGVYSKVLTESEIAEIFEAKKIVHIEYKDSLHGKGILFDGINDYLTIEQDFLTSNLKNFSIDLWIKPKELNSNLTGILGNPILGIAISNCSIMFRTNHTTSGENNLTGNFNFSNNKNYYLTFIFNGTDKEILINKELINSSSVNNPLQLTTDNLTLGANFFLDASTDRLYFDGIIDEFKFYSRILENKEIDENFYNYNSFGKGCCNYITLINSNFLGLNNSFYNKNVSSSSRIFFNYYNNAIEDNITLWSLTNLTSNETDKVYYNFLVDNCIVQAYNMPYGNKSTFYNRNIGEYQDSCENLILNGIY